MKITKTLSGLSKLFFNMAIATTSIGIASEGLKLTGWNISNPLKDKLIKDIEKAKKIKNKKKRHEKIKALGEQYKLEKILEKI